MKKQTGFTLIEILLAMLLLSFLVTMAVAVIRPMAVLDKVEMFRIERDLNRIFTAIKRYEVAQEGRVENLGIPETRSEICLETEDCDLKADISTLLPGFLSSIPVNPSIEEEQRSGYFVYKDAEGDLYIEADLGEEGVIVSRNGQILNEAPVGEVQIAGTWYGSNLWGQMGNGEMGSQTSATIETTGAIRDTGLGGRVSAYITEGGELFTAGVGLLGDGELSRNTYSQVPGSWREVEIGDNHALAIAEDGSLWGWGNNFYSQILPLGQTSYDTPALINNSRHWQGVAVTDNVSLAWDTSGELYSWGFSMRGALGQGASSWITIPTRVGGETWQRLDTGDEFVIAIDSNGHLYSWGRNHLSGNLGFNEFGLSQNTPRLIDSNTWQSVSAGSTHAGAIRDTGALYVWGNNFSGQLGLGDTVNRSTPIQVPGVWTDVASGDGYTLGIQSSGEVFAWGRSMHGAMTSSDPLFSSNTPWNTETIEASNVEASDRYSLVQ